MRIQPTSTSPRLRLPIDELRSSRLRAGTALKRVRNLLAMTGMLLVISAAVRGQPALDGFNPNGNGIFVVDSTGDGDDTVPGDGICHDSTGHCTLRAAIEEANANAGDDIVHFSIPTSDPGYNAKTNAWTITLPRALPDLSTNVAIEGPGANRLTVSGGNAFRIFNVTTKGTVSFSGMTIANGFAEAGGGILNGGTLTITNSTISGNYVSGGDYVSGGGIWNNGAVIVTNSAISGNGATYGAGIWNSGTVTLTNSTISGNSAVTGNGGYGAGILNYGSVTLTDSTINGNVALDVAAGIGNGGTMTVTNSTISENSSLGYAGGILNGGTMTVTDSTIDGNSAYYGGGIDNEGMLTITKSTLNGNQANLFGGGILNQDTLTVTNSTISGNASYYSGGGIWNNYTVTLTNSTISGNAASGIIVDGDGGGIDNYFPGTINVKSSIIALNTATGSGPDVWGVFTSQGFNLVGIDQNNGFSAGTDLTGGLGSPLDPRLDPNGLQDNDGPTQTIALLFGSPAIDKGISNGLTGDLTTDQRGTGFARTFDDPAMPNATGGDGTDIGSFELRAAPPTPTPTLTPQSTATPHVTPSPHATPRPHVTPTPTPTPTPHTPHATPTPSPHPPHPSPTTTPMQPKGQPEL